MSAPTAVIDAWNRLAEPDKKHFCIAIQKYDPEMFTCWMKISKLQGSFRPQNAAKRPTKSVGLKLDSVFFDITGGDFARRRFKDFFTVIETAINNHFLKLITTVDDKYEEFPAVLERIKDAYSDSPYVGLYCEVAMWLRDDWLDDDECGTEEEPTCPIDDIPPESIEGHELSEEGDVSIVSCESDDLDGIKSKYSTLCRLSAELVELGESLIDINSSTLDVDSAESLIRDAFEVKLRSCKIIT